MTEIEVEFVTLDFDEFGAKSRFFRQNLYDNDQQITAIRPDEESRACSTRERISSKNLTRIKPESKIRFENVNKFFFVLTKQTLGKLIDDYCPVFE